MGNHLEETLQSWIALESTLRRDVFVLDAGENSLDIANVVAVARFSAKVSIKQSPAALKLVQDSVNTLEHHLQNGEDIYGVNTGCGGNANSRTSMHDMLQKAFLQHHQCGILPGLPNRLEERHALPLDVTRGAMLTRCHSILRGHSAVRMEVIEFLVKALNKKITPVIPLRGSISASGDLSPLSYVGGLLEGNPDIFVHVVPSVGSAEATLMSASDAIQLENMVPVNLRAKEALGIMNGTAPSAGAASLVLYDTNVLLVLSQLLTAMATEALLGSVDNYHDFISQCRPHSGQIEVASNIRQFLMHSKLSKPMHIKTQGLVQDRYSLRTAPQWIGPLLEDMLLATSQVTTELNSSTDNPLIDVVGDRFHHGGNFQAASVTSAMEKVKTILMMLGRLLASQCQELINPSLNKGLPPNLCFDDPSTSFTCKAIDINMSAYLSELAFLCNSIVNHVQVAEMGNQSVNSLALIAARYATESVDVVTMMCAAQLYVLCQALDLRALEQGLFDKAKMTLSKLYSDVWPDTEHATKSFEALWASLVISWRGHSHLDLASRYEETAKESSHFIFDQLATIDSAELCPFLVSKWRITVAKTLSSIDRQVRDQFVIEAATPRYLAAATREIYVWVRESLEVPLHRGILAHPTMPGDNRNKTIGTDITKIYSAIRQGDAISVLQNAIAR